MDELDQSWVNPKISATSTPKSCRGSQRSRTPELLNIPEERSNGEKEMSLTCFPILPDSNNSVSEDVAWKPSEPPDSQLNNLLAGVDFDILMLNWCSEKDVMVLDKRKTDIMERIEKVLLNLLKDLKSGKTPMIELQGERTWGNCTMKNEM